MLHPHLTQWAKAIQELELIEKMMLKYDIESALNEYFDKRDFEPLNPHGASNKTGYVHYPINLPEMYLGWSVFYYSDNTAPSDLSVEVELIFTDNSAKTESRRFAVRCDIDSHLWIASYLDMVFDHAPDIASPLGDEFAGNFNLSIDAREAIPRLQAMYIIEDMAKLFRHHALKSFKERTNKPSE